MGFFSEEESESKEILSKKFSTSFDKEMPFVATYCLALRIEELFNFNVNFTLLSMRIKYKTQYVLSSKKYEWVRKIQKIKLQI